MKEVVNMDEVVGIVVGISKPTEFYFVTDESKQQPLWEYVMVKGKEYIDGEERDVQVLAQICNQNSQSDMLPYDMSLDIAEKVSTSGMAEKRIVMKARVMGFVHNGKIYQVRRAVHPGSYVYRAPDNLLRDFYSYDEDEALHIGYLLNRNVPVSISLKGFRRHLAILAQTGAGKSYTTGVLMEELLEKGATVIVLDPHADYVRFWQKVDGGHFTDRYTVYKTRESTGRYDESQIPKLKYYEVKFSDLEDEEIFEIAGIPEKYSNIREAISKTIEKLKNENKDYTIDEFIEHLKTIKIDKDKHVGEKAVKYIKKLKKLRVWGDTSTPLDYFLKPKYVSILDLSGLNDAISNYIAYKILTELYERANKGELKYPVFVVIEEAHRFIPKDSSTYAKDIIRKIAAEGRKFGIFLILITQRPYKIHQDALSQCNSQIILRIKNPEDQKAVKISAENLSEDLLGDLAGLNTGEAVILGEITKVPVMVKIRERKTKEGGGDIDIVASLKKAREEADREEKSMEESIKEIREMLGGD